jgi:hypothetical protein
MSIRIALFGATAVAAASVLLAQTLERPKSAGWRAADGGRLAAAEDEADAPAASDVPMGSGSYRSGELTRVTRGSGTLPNDQGQIWREYDISPYTLRPGSTERPEQAIVDWILRETGYEVWHSEPVALLCASPQTLRVYHTPAMQAIVAEIVDRFVNIQTESQVFGLRVVTLGNPNWRSKGLRLMKPVPVQSQGVQGWLLAREDAGLLLAELKKRTDFREHGSPNMMVKNGQSTVISAVRPRSYVRSVIPAAGAWPGYNPEAAQIEEGYSLQFTPLLSLDRQSVDAVIKVQLHQVEKMVPVMLDMPTPVAPRQRIRVEIPQMTMCHLHERFRWPTDQVLLLSMGVVATPDASAGNSITGALPFASSPPRADALLFIESKGTIVESPATPSAVARQPQESFSGRY